MIRKGLKVKSENRKTEHYIVILVPQPRCRELNQVVCQKRSNSEKVLEMKFQERTSTTLVNKFNKCMLRAYFMPRNILAVKEKI